MITEVNNQTNQISQEEKPVEEIPEEQKEKQEKTKGEKKKSKKTEDETKIEQNDQVNEFISLENYQQVETPDEIYQKNKKEFILLEKELLNSVVGKEIEETDSEITAKTKYNLIFLVRIDLIIEFLKDSNNPENFNEFMKIREKFGVVHKLYWNLYLKKTKKEDVENLRFWVDHVIESGMKKSYSQGEKNNLNLQVMYNEHRQKFFEILRNQKYFGNASIQMCVKGTKFSDNENKNRENQIFIPREVIADFIDLMEMEVEFDLEEMNETEVSEPEKQYKKKMEVSVWY